MPNGGTWDEHHAVQRRMNEELMEKLAMIEQLLRELIDVVKQRGSDVQK